ncbi:DUF3072 domain-containing protein [Roseicyclus sp. F158]|uniref:DUF3072 domain-containing protein n=1 Tax=Tropicimonas omnivorans TaxID=3075590 RepID=A0ABU3DG35_9RHOB|nr:DUF3072 domain-containing protein [Roseicyclus sp. F158]MDT0682107.1 DUF3072 domain-containing protein [Roseicyclus sp. F158]
MPKTPDSFMMPNPAAAPDSTATGRDDPMTAETSATLRALCDKAGEPFDASLTEEQALRRKAELEGETGLDAGG